MISVKKQLFEIPEPSTESVTDATLQIVGRIGILRYDYYREGTAFRSAIRFSGLMAARTLSERCSAAWHIEGVYDTLSEVTNSEWIQEVREGMPERYRGDLSLRHFMIYLDSAGCFEILAESYDVTPEEVGSWEHQTQCMQS